MTPFNEFALAISAIILVITSIVGVILLSTSVFKINASLKKTVDVIETYQRPYLVITLIENHLSIKNTGKSQATIDSFIINDDETLDELDNKVINPKQSFLIKNNFKNQKELDVKITYHSDSKSYQENLFLK